MLLHEIENNETSERHLKDNGEKFSRHCNFVLSLMYIGKRFTARQLEREYNIDGRRLRDIFANRKECKREWLLCHDGKTREMEYWLEIPKPQTKQNVVKFYQQQLSFYDLPQSSQIHHGEKQLSKHTRKNY